MKYNLAQVNDYEAVFVTFPDGVKIYVNNLHKDFNTIKEVLEDNTIDNNDIAYMILVRNFLNCETDVEKLENAIKTSVEKSITEINEEPLVYFSEENRFIPVDVEELKKVVAKLCPLGEPIRFDYVPQSDYDNEEDFPHINQAVFPISVTEEVLLACDSEANGLVYRLEGMFNLYYLGMNEETASELDEKEALLNSEIISTPTQTKKKFSWFGLRKV